MLRLLLKISVGAKPDKGQLSIYIGNNLLKMNKSSEMVGNNLHRHLVGTLMVKVIR